MPGEKPSNSASTKPPTEDTEAAAKSLWFALPAAERTVRRVTDTLRERGYKVSKTVIGRWKLQWDSETPPAQEAAQHLLPGPAQLPDDDDFADVPVQFKEALGIRLLAVSKGKGLDRVEDAVILLANAIGSKAKQIAEQLLDSETETTETTAANDKTESKKTVQKAQVARSAVTAIATLAQSMQVIVSSRQVVSMSDRNFAEGDMLRAQARKLNAEAEALEGHSRANNARDVTPNNSGGASDEAQEAMDALRGMAKVVDVAPTKR